MLSFNSLETDVGEKLKHDLMFKVKGEPFSIRNVFSYIEAVTPPDHRGQSGAQTRKEGQEIQFFRLKLLIVVMLKEGESMVN